MSRPSYEGPTPQQETILKPLEDANQSPPTDLSELRVAAEMPVVTGTTVVAQSLALRRNNSSNANQSSIGAPTEFGGRVDPIYLATPEPTYPLAAQHRRQEGNVLLSVKVSAQGKPARVALAQSSGFPLLDEAAIAAVRRWEFAPARVGLQAVAADIEVPVNFALRR